MIVAFRYNRSLAKLSKAVKVAVTSNQGKAESKALFLDADPAAKVSISAKSQSSFTQNVQVERGHITSAYEDRKALDGKKSWKREVDDTVIYA